MKVLTVLVIFCVAAVFAISVEEKSEIRKPEESKNVKNEITFAGEEPSDNENEIVNNELVRSKRQSILLKTHLSLDFQN